MDPRVYAILTILVIGIISFLIGWLLTSSKWRNKYEEENQAKLNLERHNKRLEKSLDQSKKMQEEGRSRLQLINADVRLLEKEVKQLKKDKKYLSDKLGVDKEKDGKVFPVTKNKSSLQSLFDKEQVKSVTAYTKVIDLDKEVKDPAVKEPKEENNFILDETINTSTKERTNHLGDTHPLAHIVRRTIIFSNKEHRDDLHEIKGITKKVAKELKEIGFVCFKQIAILTAKDLEDISVALGFDKDKAMDDAWVAQANKLYNAKYES